MNTVCGFSAFTSGLYSPYWKRMGMLISENTANRIWQSKHCVLCGDICEMTCGGYIYASSGCGEDMLDAYIKNGELPRDKTGAIWDGKNEKVIVFSAETEIFYATPSGRFVFSTLEKGLLSFPGVYNVPQSGILKLNFGESISYSKTGAILLSLM